MGESAERAFVVTFHGVRGSTPCSSPAHQRYGGNTSCVAVESEGADPIVLDMGTGIRAWGCDLVAAGPITVHALVTHLHWDHVQGLPFFRPLQQRDSRLLVYGPPDESGSFGDCFRRLMAPPFFPVTPDDLPARIEFQDAHDRDFVIGDVTVTARPVPHTGPTTGYRLSRDGISVVYIPDHQEPVGRPDLVAPEVLELCRDADLLIHDSQFRTDEFACRSNWGHCTVDYAIEVARQSGVKTLALFHHDPGHDDEELDRLGAEAAERGAAVGVEVISAIEGLKLSVEPRI